MSNQLEPPPAAMLPLLALAGRRLLPIVQGGMGVGISAHRLAGSVARQGAVGTLASVDLRRHHADLMADTRHCGDKAQIDQLKLEVANSKKAHDSAKSELEKLKVSQAQLKKQVDDNQALRDVLKKENANLMRLLAEEKALKGPSKVIPVLRK